MQNRYEKAADALILQHKKVTLHNIENSNGDPASWDDQYWKFKDSKGRYQGVAFYKITTGCRARKIVLRDAQFSDTLRHLLMCFALEKRIDRGVSPKLAQDVMYARHFIARVDLFSLTQYKINELFTEHVGDTWLPLLNIFITWCKNKGILRESLIVPAVNSLDRDDADIALENHARKIPDERALWMIGAIRNEIIPKIDKQSATQYEPKLGDALTISCATLAMASPLRMVAEQFTLGKQLLESKLRGSEELYKDVAPKEKGKKIHWLNWNGSKDFPDNRKHFFEVMAEPVTEVLDYWWRVGEPARILCRFYENPRQPLRLLLGHYIPKNVGDFDLNKPVNMFALGVVLGFYENPEQSVTVYISGKIKSPKNCTEKSIRNLLPTDRLKVSRESLLLFGQKFPFETISPEANLRGILTVAEIQEEWIVYIKKNVPTFPNRIIGKNTVKLSNAMFILTGQQYAGKGSYPLSCSFFAIESVDAGRYVEKSLAVKKKGGNIFQRYGFASDIGLTPHQLRHWSNTKMQESGISDEVIAMVSGRVDVNQNAVYDHTNESDKIALMSNLVSKDKTPEEMKKEVRVIGRIEIQEATGKNATITATGACTQEITTNPCTYLNDFVTHCALCSSSCHFAHDEKAIDLLQKDLKCQQVRLTQAENNPKLKVNTRLQNWFKLHHTNVVMLEQLIELMMREDIAIGTGIRYIKDNAAFRITDFNKRKFEDVKALLPDSKGTLERLLQSISDNNESPQSTNIDLDNLLSQFDIQEVS